jgi:hypothetical protein
MKIIDGNGKPFQSLTTKYIQELLHTHDAFLLRNWSINNAFDFSSVVDLCGIPKRTDISCSAGPRIEICSGVFTANDAPPEHNIPFHHEMAQCEYPPSHVAFYCEMPPTSGGCTPTIESGKIATELIKRYPNVAQRLRIDGLRYLRQYPSSLDMYSPLGKSWRETFQVDSRETLERLLTEKSIEWEWKEDDILQTIEPVIYPLHTVGSTEVLFLAAETSFLKEQQSKHCPVKAVIDGNDYTLHSETREAFLHLSDFADKHCTRIPWQKGDVVILNNALVQHARDFFIPPRQIFISLLGYMHNPTFEKKYV